MTVDTYSYRDFLRDVISPVALSVMERMTPAINDIYQLDQLLDSEVPCEHRVQLQDRFTERIRRIVRLLPPGISPVANEIYTAIEFLIYEVHGEPVHIGLAIARLEELSDEICADPLLKDLILGRAN